MHVLLLLHILPFFYSERVLIPDFRRLSTFSCVEGRLKNTHVTLTITTTLHSIPAHLEFI